MASNILNLPSAVANKLSFRKIKVDYWKTSMILMAVVILGGFALKLISGLATIILTTLVGLILIAKPIKDIFQMDFSLDDLDLKDIHDDLWE